MSLTVVGSPFFSLVNHTTDRLVGMWESRVLCEISKSLWKPLFGFHRDGISTAVFVVAFRARDRNSGEAVPLPAFRSSFLAPPTRSFLIHRGVVSLTRQSPPLGTASPGSLRGLGLGIDGRRRPVPEALMGPLVIVQLDNTTPIGLSLEASYIRGIHGAGALSRCTRF